MNVQFGQKIILIKVHPPDISAEMEKKGKTLQYHKLQTDIKQEKNFNKTHNIKKVLLNYRLIVLCNNKVGFGFKIIHFKRIFHFIHFLF